MKILASFFMILIGGEIAPIGCVLGIVFSMIGAIALLNLEPSIYSIAGIVSLLFGATILFFRIRKDILEIKDDFKSEKK